MEAFTLINQMFFHGHARIVWLDFTGTQEDVMNLSLLSAVGYVGSGEWMV